MENELGIQNVQNFTYIIILWLWFWYHNTLCKNINGSLKLNKLSNYSKFYQSSNMSKYTYNNILQYHINIMKINFHLCIL